MKIVGRKIERRELDRLCASGKPEFAVVYGRRRVGKTFLVREYFGNDFAFYATGVAGGNMKSQLSSFNASLRRYGASLEKPAASWFDAFEALVDLLSGPLAKRDAASGRLVVFIDELPWLDTARSNFKSALEWFWNGWASAQPDVLLIVCGSATSWIIGNLLKERGGLHNRVTARIKLDPFTLAECDEYFSENDLALSKSQVIEAYMTFGGIPYYLDLMDRRLGLVQNIDRLCFNDGAPLAYEFDELFHSLFSHAERHVEVVRFLAQKGYGSTRSEIEKGTKMRSGGTLTGTLEELEQCGFIRKYAPPGLKKRDMLYQLIDPFVLFYLRFMGKGAPQGFWSQGLGNAQRRTWVGHAFELVCLLHVPQIKEALGVPGIQATSYSWRSRTSEPGAQIDLVIDRADGIINICEAKYSQVEFSIDKACDADLRNKLDAFQRETGTRKSLHMTLMSPFGLKQGKYAGVVQNVITADDLLA